MGVVPGVGVCVGVWLGVGVPEGDGLGECVGLGEWLADRDGVGTGEVRTGGAGVVGVGFDCRVGSVLAEPGRTQMYSANTARNSPMMTRVEVRGRLITGCSPSRDRYPARR